MYSLPKSQWPPADRFQWIKPSLKSFNLETQSRNYVRRCRIWKVTMLSYDNVYAKLFLTMPGQTPGPNPSCAR